MSVVCDVIHSLGAFAFEIEIQTKNTEDGDELATPVTATVGTAPAPITLGQNVQTTFSGGSLLDGTSPVAPPPPGLRELVRFKYILSEGAPGELVHFRMLVGSWLSNRGPAPIRLPVRILVGSEITMREIDYLSDGSLQLEDTNLTQVVDPEPWNTPRAIRYTAGHKRVDRLERALAKSAEPDWLGQPRRSQHSDELGAGGTLRDAARVGGMQAATAELRKIRLRQRGYACCADCVEGSCCDQHGHRNTMQFKTPGRSCCGGCPGGGDCEGGCSGGCDRRTRGAGDRGQTSWDSEGRGGDAKYQPAEPPPWTKRRESPASTRGVWTQLRDRVIGDALSELRSMTGVIVSRVDMEAVIRRDRTRMNMTVARELSRLGVKGRDLNGLVAQYLSALVPDATAPVQAGIKIKHGPLCDPGIIGMVLMPFLGCPDLPICRTFFDASDSFWVNHYGRCDWTAEPMVDANGPYWEMGCNCVEGIEIRWWRIVAALAAAAALGWLGWLVLQRVAASIAAALARAAAAAARGAPRYGH